MTDTRYTLLAHNNKDYRSHQALVQHSGFGGEGVFLHTFSPPSVGVGVTMTSVRVGSEFTVDEATWVTDYQDPVVTPTIEDIRLAVFGKEFVAYTTSNVDLSLPEDVHA